MSYASWGCADYYHKLFQIVKCENLCELYLQLSRLWWTVAEFPNETITNMRRFRRYHLPEHIWKDTEDPLSVDLCKCWLAKHRRMLLGEKQCYMISSSDSALPDHCNISTAFTSPISSAYRAGSQMRWGAICDSAWGSAFGERFRNERPVHCSTQYFQ